MLAIERQMWYNYNTEEDDVKIVINDSYGDALFSCLVCKELGVDLEENIDHKYECCLNNKSLGINSNNEYAFRADLHLIAAIQKIGIKESARYGTKLKIVDIPDNVKWRIHEKNDSEIIREVHRVWY